MFGLKLKWNQSIFSFFLGGLYNYHLFMELMNSMNNVSCWGSFLEDEVKLSERR